MNVLPLEQAKSQQQCLQQLQPPGALKLLQYWPALQLELLLLVDCVGLKVLLLNTSMRMLQACMLGDAPDAWSNLNAAKSTLIAPLLQLVLPHVQQLITGLRASAGSSITPQTSSSSSSESAAGGGAVHNRTAAAESYQQLRMLMILRTRCTRCCWSASRG
jgi:hypothetical protein